MVYSGSIILHSTHLIFIFMMNLLVSEWYNLYVSSVWLYAYQKMMALYVLYFICFLIFPLLVTYARIPRSEKTQ